MSSSGELLPDTNLAPKLLISGGILVVISTCLWVARIFTRLRPVPHLHLDDYLISLATVVYPSPVRQVRANVLADYIHY